MTGIDRGGLARVEALLDLERPAEARTLLATLLATEPADPDANALLARAELGLDNPRAAFGAAGRVIAARPDAEYGHRLRALALRQSRHYTPALEAAGTCVRIAPERWETHYVFASIAAELPARRRDGEAAARRAIALAPEESDTHFALGLVLHQQGRRAAAQDAYRETLTLEPGHLGAINNLTMLERGHRLGAAAGGYGAVLRLDPQERVARRNLGLVLIRYANLVWALSALATLFALIAYGGDRDGTVPTGWPASVVVPVLVTAICAVTAAAASARVHRRLPGGLGRFLRERWEERPRFTATLTLAGLSLVAVLLTETLASLRVAAVEVAGVAALLDLVLLALMPLLSRQARRF